MVFTAYDTICDRKIRAPDTRTQTFDLAEIPVHGAECADG
jgi:hypothetical protein